MSYSISKKSKSPDMNYLIDEFESPVEYDFPSPPKSKPKSVKKNTYQLLIQIILM